VNAQPILTSELAGSIGLWIGGLLTLMIFSFLYRDNPFYKFAEHLFVGVSAAYWMVVGFWSTLVPNLIARLWPSHMGNLIPSAVGNRTEYMYVIPLVFGLMMLMRLSPKANWFSRWAMAFVIGFAAGTNFTRYLQSDFVSQIHSSIEPIYTPGLSVMGTVGDVFSKLIIVGGLLSSLIYFYFSKEHKGAFGRAARLGIWVLMAAFGATFGYTVMARISLLTGRMDYLIRWIGGIFT
jgi:hypothetical protein